MTMTNLPTKYIREFLNMYFLLTLFQVISIFHKQEDKHSIVERVVLGSEGRKCRKRFEVHGD